MLQNNEANRTPTERGEGVSHSEVGRDENVILEHFANELRPQILLRYPSAPMEKVNKVIQQKWNTIEPSKKEAYICKVNKKL